MRCLYFVVGVVSFFGNVNHPMFAEDLWSYDTDCEFKVELTGDSPIGEASIREHAVLWHPVKQKYYLIADVVPLKSHHHPNTYETEIHLWSGIDLAKWQYHGVAIKKGIPEKSYDAYGVASPAGAAFLNGKIYVPFSARRTKQFTQRGIGLAWSGSDPEQLPWVKSNKPISDLEGEDDDPALMKIPGENRLNLYHRRTGPGGYRIVHTTSDSPERTDSWPAAKPATSRPDEIRAQELTGAFFADGKCHLFVIEHFKVGGIKIANLVSENPAGPFLPVDEAKRYLPPQSQPGKLAYSGHISPVARAGKLNALFWTVPQKGKRYGLLGHPLR